MDNKIENHGIEATRLCTHKDNVGEINQEKMTALKNQSKVFIANDSDLEYVVQLDKVLPVLHKLELKVGAQVGFYEFILKLDWEIEKKWIDKFVVLNIISKHEHMIFMIIKILELWS